MRNYRFIYTLAIIIILVGAGFSAHEIFIIRDSAERVLRVEPGDSATTISNKLKDAGIIRHPSAFRLLTKLRKADGALKPGTYVFGGHTNLWNTVTRLLRGTSESIRITFPEGLSMHNTFKRIEKHGLASYEAMQSAAADTALVRRLTGFPLNSPEGFLYPETYLFPLPSSPDSILAIMTSEFRRKLHKASIDPRKIENFYDKLILASIVEKEAGNEEERPVIAGVFSRRLRLGMALQSCPTVDYILEKQGIRRAVLTNADTQINSPYNTYRNPGLPPTPISNPRVESILAALNPAEHNYLYFFADLQGKNVFSSSYEEHQRLQRKMGL
jgi:UPF0755 protein